MTANRLPLFGWLFILGWLSAAAGSANAQPITPAADGTKTVVTPNGNRYDISGGSLGPEGANLFHSFTQFGLSEGQTANFLTNPNIQNILGRITGGNPSLINGLIQVTGGNSNLFLMNPAGLIFGPNASLNVPGSFNATTATGIGFGNNQWFSAIGNNNWATLIGKPNSFAFTNSQGGSIVNAGNLTVTPGQSLSLVGGTVVNTGQLNAPGGNILISAVQDNKLVRISQAGNLLSLEIGPTATGDSLPNNWTQPVLSLPELLTGKGAAQATNLTVNPQGEVVLTGDVAVPVTAGTAIASGTLNVSGDTGGNVNILGEKVGVIAGNINANGINGGGNVLIGGDYQGLGTVPNALRAFVSGDSTINADAVSNGQGGRVIVWADETTRFNGNISARGGLFSGNGGFVEVSGKQSLDFQGLVDLRSTFGIAGTLLLDPNDITISTEMDEGGGFLAGGVFAPAAGIPSSRINNGTLQEQLSLGNVTISTESISGSAEGNITVSGQIFWTNNNSLTLKANNSIFVNKNITSNGGSITLNADADGSGAGAIAITTATISSSGGNIILGGGTNPLISPASGTVANYRGVSITNSILNAGTGNIFITGKGRPGEPANEGIFVSISTITTAGAGSISLTGTGGGNGGGTGEFLFTPPTHGISLSGSGITTAGTGSIILKGTGGNGTSGDNNGINIVNGSTVQSLGAGSITLDGTGGNGNNRNLGISIIDTSTVRSAGGNISLTGTGAGIGSGNVGVKVINSTVESTANGAVTISGTGALNGTSGNTGIAIYPGTATVRSQNGDITLTGKSKGSENTNEGIALYRLVESKGTGKVTLRGEGGNGNSFLNQGIYISPEGTVQSQDGDITLSGTGNGLGDTNTGIRLIQGRVESLGIGEIILSGAGGDGTDRNQGISLMGATVQASSGNVTLSGNGRGKGTLNHGISVESSPSAPIPTTIQTAGLGKVTLRGVGSGGTGANFGIGMNSGTVRSQNGDIALTGTGIGASTNNDGINFSTGGPITVQATGTGNISLTGIANNNTLPINLISGVIAATGGNVTLTGDEIQLSGTTQVNGKGTITLQPRTTSLDILIGGTQNTPDVPPLNLIQTEVDRFKGFAQMVIGRTDGTGAIVVDPAGIQFNSFNTATTIQPPTGTGLIAVNGPITAQGNITFNGTTSLSANVTASDKIITFNSPVIVANQVNLNTGPGAGEILFQKNVYGKTANSQDLTLTAGSGKITFGGDAGSVTSLGNLKINSAGNVQTKAITAASITQTAGTGTTAFKGLVKTTAAGGINLTGTNFAIENPVTTLNNGTFKVNNSGDLNIATAATLLLDGEFTQSGTGPVNIGSNITTTNDNISFNSPVTLTNNISFNTGELGAGDIIFNNKVDGTTANSRNLTLTAGTGNIRFTAGEIGNSTTPFGTITANSSGTTSFASSVNAQSLTTDSGGTTQLNGPVTTTGPQTYGDAVTIANNSILLGSEITFTDTVNGSSALTVNGSSGNVRFNKAIGETKPLTSLTANSEISLGGNVTTTGPQTYGDAVTITNNSILSGSEITFNNTVDGSSALTVKEGTGNVRFNKAIGETTP
ncbi:filamentous hemagglutinin N-terminal domain-containing protein, partial [Microcoleus sp. AR_TQ3_B6]|uniref:two-partner secretion domain-containing protein n=1 Tax=Microcoleus sp. AR_TQ3_B6 TaxID=3055284 RepID=UPI002FD036E0